MSGIRPENLILDEKPKVPCAQVKGEVMSYPDRELTSAVEANYRMTCLTLANAHDMPEPASDVVARAEAYAAFVIGSAVADDPNE